MRAVLCLTRLEAGSYNALRFERKTLNRYHQRF